MKKIYITPQVSVTALATVSLVCASGVSSDGDYGIGYGGVDEEGNLDPSARRRRRNKYDWNDEEDLNR